MPSIESMFPTAARLLRRLSGRPRRIAAAGCAAAAALLLLSSAGGGGDEDGVESVAVAARDLPAGAVLDEADVRVASWPRTAAPPGALHSAEQAAGRRIGAAMGVGEPITQRRLADGSYGDSLRRGAVAVIVTVDSQALLARAGDRIDIYASGGSSAEAYGDDYPAEGRPVGAGGSSGDEPLARLVAPDIRVLAALPGTRAADGGQLVLEVDRSMISAVASARDRRITVAVIPP